MRRTPAVAYPPASVDVRASSPLSFPGVVVRPSRKGIVIRRRDRRCTGRGRRKDVLYLSVEGGFSPTSEWSRRANRSRATVSPLARGSFANVSRISGEARTRTHCGRKDSPAHLLAAAGGGK